MQVISVLDRAQQSNFPVPEITAKYTTPDNDYLANRFASTITGPYKQDIAMVLQGQKGSGKSYASLRIAYNTARRVAEIRDGDWREWPRYFSMENVAIIDPDRASSIIAHAKPYNIYIFDDIGVGWNSRAFASKENRDKNDIFQINRVAQTVQILSMPNQFLLDKVPRMLCNYLAEMDSTNFSKGLSTMKVFRAKTVFRLDNLRINPHLVATTGEKIVKHVIVRPPKFLAEQYDKIRQETTQKIIAARAQGGEEESGKRAASNAISDEEIQDCIIPEIEARIILGMNEGEAVRDFASSAMGRSLGFTHNRFYYLKKTGRLADNGYHRTGRQRRGR